MSSRCQALITCALHRKELHRVTIKREKEKRRGHKQSHANMQLGIGDLAAAFEDFMTMIRCSWGFCIRDYDMTHDMRGKHGLSLTGDHFGSVCLARMCAIGHFYVSPTHLTQFHKHSHPFSGRQVVE